MATLAEQLESALEGTGSAMSASNIEDMLSGTATSITPGTVTPISPQQSNQLSWNQVFSKIGEGVALKPGEGLPEVPKNIPASTFYRTATQAGKLPSGGAQFFTKPLASETKPWKLTDTPTTTTPATTSATTSQQNIVRQMREAVDLSPQDSTMGDSDLQRSFEEGTGWSKDPTGEYNIGIYGPTTLADHEQYMQQQLVDAYDAYDKGDPSQLQQLGFSPDVAAMYERRGEAQAKLDKLGPDIELNRDVIKGDATLSEYFGRQLAELGYDIVNAPANIIQDIKDGFKNLEEKPIPTLAKGGLGILASKYLGFPASMLVKPLLDVMFSEGGGQIGTTGIVSDDYWNGETFGTSTFSAVHGFANTGSGLSVAVDINGNILGTASGINKGVTMYGIATKRGQAAWDAKQARDAKKDKELTKTPKYPKVKTFGYRGDDSTMDAAVTSTGHTQTSFGTMHGSEYGGGYGDDSAGGGGDTGGGGGGGGGMGGDDDESSQW